jgi:hypothetical protein
MKIKSAIFLLAIILIFSASAVKAQTHKLYLNNLEIIITSSNVLKEGNFFIDITKYDDFTKIVYKFQDSVDYKRLFVNKQYKNLSKCLDTLKNNKSRSELYLEMYNIAQKYTYFSKDSLQITTRSQPLYFELLGKVNKTSSDSLENKIVNENRIVLDGTYFGFTIKNGKNERTVQAHSPDPKSHPLLYELLNQTFNIYRETKNNSFLTANRTDGY